MTLSDAVVEPQRANDIALSKTKKSVGSESQAQIRADRRQALADSRMPTQAESAVARMASENSPPMSETSEEVRPSFVDLSASAAVRWRQTVWEDCHGEIVIDCRRLIDTFTRVLEAPDFVDDGWSDWMEGQIRESLSTKAREYKSTRTDVKCAPEGCVFIFYSDTAKKMFHHGWRHANDFDRWLRKQPWNEWLEVHSKQNDNKSTLSWRVVGSLSASPFINWYIVTRQR
jgi:hypothetical protein